MSELVIDESNFTEYFKDCRIHRPERGDVMAKYTAIAEFVDGAMKKDVIHLLLNHDKPQYLNKEDNYYLYDYSITSKLFQQQFYQR